MVASPRPSSAAKPENPFMTHLPMFAASVGVVTAGGALWVQSRRHIDRRLFAGLVAAAVTLSLCSLLVWATTSIGRMVSLPLTWAFVSVLIVLFALRLYRELRVLPRNEPRQRLSE
jgi:hypothetical protein